MSEVHSHHFLISITACTLCELDFQCNCKPTASISRCSIHHSLSPLIVFFLLKKVSLLCASKLVDSRSDLTGDNISKVGCLLLYCYPIESVKRDVFVQVYLLLRLVVHHGFYNTNLFSSAVVSLTKINKVKYTVTMIQCVL